MILNPLLSIATSSSTQQHRTANTRCCPKFTSTAFSIRFVQRQRFCGVFNQELCVFSICRQGLPMEAGLAGRSLGGSTTDRCLPDYKPVLGCMLHSVAQNGVVDQRLVCSLLCCSKGLQKLVHLTCAGKVDATMQCGPYSPPPWPSVAAQGQFPGSSSTAPRCVLGKWLAEHAALLRTLQLEGITIDEGSIAAGLEAAAATAATAAAASGDTASGSASSMDSHQHTQQHKLQLSQLVCQVPVIGDIIYGLISTSVTSLELRLAAGPDPSQRGIAALPQLVSLQHLALSYLGPNGAVWQAIASKLKLLSSLITLSTDTLDLAALKTRDLTKFTWPASTIYNYPDSLQELKISHRYNRPEGLGPLVKVTLS